ncbi:GNAT family N-acetyltransferase [uncultured Alistipes sp.]|uniref:GNAT family N-acetyltransferase n=1 Tax=uncultured Alistipes sp. TaxID=538949 RepID=UPI00266FC614|nr:GNAT family N-acetyltransferase [uncultured Alistipes sp.]
MKTTSIERLVRPTAAELDALTALWEVSVRATHDFLSPEDIGFYRRIVREEALPGVTLYVIRTDRNEFAAFAGTTGEMLEMLFVAPGLRGKGVGRQLTEHLIARCGVRRVDVNEQNPQAAGFYARLGFRVVSRDPFDPSGRPYPILHLALADE